MFENDCACETLWQTKLEIVSQAISQNKIEKKWKKQPLGFLAIFPSGSTTENTSHIFLHDSFQETIPKCVKSLAASANVLVTIASRGWAAKALNLSCWLAVPPTLQQNSKRFAGQQAHHDTNWIEARNEAIGPETKEAAI